MLAKNYKFFNTIISFSVIHLVLACSLTYLVAHATLNDIAHKSMLIPAPLMHMLFMPAAISLLALFFFTSTPPKYHNAISVCIPLAVAFGGILACSIKNTVMYTHITLQGYTLIFTICSLYCFLAAKFYRFEADLQAPEKNIHVRKIQFSSYILLFLSGALLGIVIGFPMLFSKSYFTEALILSFGRGMSPLDFHWISLSLFLLPAHYVLKKIGFLKTTYVSIYVSILGVVFLVAILWLNVEMTLPIYSAFRLIFACSSALILAPLFLIVYKSAQKTNSIYSPVLWTSWGYIMTIALRAFLQTHIQSPTLLTNILMLLAVLLLYLFTIRMTKVEHSNC
jgi:hypothetical protein